MSALLGLLLIGVAQAEDCPVPLEPEAVASRLEKVKDDVLFGEPSAQKELAAIEASLPCLNGPLDQAELGKLMLGQAAYSTFMGTDGSVYYQRAAGLGASDPDYGPEVQGKLDSVQPAPPALLVLDFEPVPAVILVDGAITYSTGPRELPSGWHIVQWLEDDGWQVRVLDLDPSQEALISVRSQGAAVPEDVPSDEPEKDRSRDKTPREKETKDKTPREKTPREKVAQEKTPREKTPREKTPRDRSGEPTVLATAAMGYQLTMSALRQDGQVYSGLQGGPTMVLRARSAGAWHLRMGAELVPGASGSRSGSPARGHLAFGWQSQGGLGVALGPVLGGASTLTPGGAGEDPSFTPGRAWGAGVVLQLQPVEPLTLELQGQWINAGYGGALLAQVHVVDLGPLPILASLGGQHWQSPTAGRVSWVQVGFGSSLSF